MSITISIIKSPADVFNQQSSMEFDNIGGTIGRAANNFWVLDDPERFISSRHSQITCENGQYYLTDLSTNGTFLNGSSEPIGKGNKVAINDGDTFSLGDYEFSACMAEENQFSGGSSPFSFVPDTPGIEVDYLDDPSALSFDDPFAASLSGHVSSSEPLFSDYSETDPLAALDKANQGFNSPESDPFANGSYADEANVLNQAAEWPNAVPEAGVIPDDWDDDLMVEAAPVQKPVLAAPSAPPTIPPVMAEPVQAAPASTYTPEPVQATPRPAYVPEPTMSVQTQAVNNDVINQLEAQNRLLIEENQKLQADVDLLAKQIRDRQKKPGSASAVDFLLIEAMGLAGENLSEARMMEISQTVGELIRETISGLMQVLSSRSTVKNEFRMNVTTIQPVENNPLKFSANIEDALENMFLRESQAYKKPVEAVREGFQGIAEHQVAILAGIRAAFRGVIEKFDPITLEQRFEKYRKAGLLQVVNKGKNWDSYKEYYNELVNDMDNSFQHLFGYDFVQAYEDQLFKISSSRRTTSKL